MATLGSACRTGLCLMRRWIRGQISAADQDPEDRPRKLEIFEENAQIDLHQPMFDQRIRRRQQGEEDREDAERNDPGHQRAQPSRRPCFHVPERAEQIAGQSKWTAKRHRHGFEQQPLPGGCFASRQDDHEQRRCQRAQDYREQIDVLDHGKQAGDEHCGHDDLGLARRVHAIAGDTDDAEHAEKQGERDADVPAVEQPVGQRDTGDGEQERYDQRAGGGGSKFEIGRGRDRHGLLFPRCDEGEVSDFGFWSGLRCIALRQRDDGRSNRWRFQPPAIPEQPPGQPRSPKLNGDDLRHGRTMPGRLAARLPDPLRICGLLCRFRAGVRCGVAALP